MMGAVADDLIVAGLPDDVLLRSVTALRRLGARITRYDVEALTLEARFPPRPRPWLLQVQTGAALLRLLAAETGEAGRTRLAVRVEPDSRLPWLGRGWLVRRFARELARITTTPTTGRIDQR